MISGKVLIGGMVVAAMLVVLSAGSLVAHEDHAMPRAADTGDDTGMMSSQNLHEAMHAMMDAMHGAGTTVRIHEAMGPEGEELMAQCTGMMATMMGMMDGGDMSGMMNGGGMMHDGGMMGGHEMPEAATPPSASSP